MVLDCAGEHCSDAQPRDVKSESLECSGGSYEIEGAIPRCCKFQRRSQDRRPTVSERDAKLEPGQPKSLGTDAFIAFSLS